jgi:hypothetical protein
MKEKGFKKEQMSSQPTAPKLKKMMPLDGHHNFFPAGYDL